MGFSRVGIELEGSAACRFGLGERLFAPAVVLRAKCRAVGEARVRKSVVGVERDSAPVHVLRGVECLRPALMEELAPAQVVLVCAHTLSRNLAKCRFFRLRQYQLQRVDDVRRYLVLNGEYVGELAIVSL